MELTRLSRRTGAGLDPCAALRVPLELAPGEQRDITCMLGQADSAAQARKMVLELPGGPGIRGRIRPDQGMVGWSARHDRSAYPRTGRRPPDQPLAPVPVA